MSREKETDGRFIDYDEKGQNQCFFFIFKETENKEKDYIFSYFSIIWSIKDATYEQYFLIEI